MPGIHAFLAAKRGWPDEPGHDKKGFRDEELLADVIARLIGDVRHVAVGNASPIPATAALLARERGNRRGLTCRCCKAASIISSPTARANCSTAPAKAASMCSFSRAARSTAQGNVNLVSTGDYEHPKVRFPGSFGSAYLYYVVPKVILFRIEHSRRTLVPQGRFHQRAGRATSQTSIARAARSRW